MTVHMLTSTDVINFYHPQRRSSARIKIARFLMINRTVRKLDRPSGEKIYPLPDAVMSGYFTKSKLQLLITVNLQCAAYKKEQQYS
jgi:hypothetical protein